VLLTPGPLSDLATPKSVSDLTDLLGQTMVDVSRGKIDPKRENALGVLATAWLKSVQLAEEQKQNHLRIEVGSLQNANAFQVYAGA